MRRSRTRRAYLAAVIAAAQSLLAALTYCAAGAGAQQLPARRYGLREGLASNRVNSIYQDSKGYLWLGTWDGLSRFDGYRFVNYGQRDGLELPFVNSVLEDRWGRIWVGTWGSGVARLADDLGEGAARAPGDDAAEGRKKFVTYRVGETRADNEITAMLIDRDDALWCVTGKGVYRAAAIGQGQPRFELVLREKVEAALADGLGRLWFVGREELIEIARGGVFRHELPGGLIRLPVADAAEGEGGRLLVADAAGVLEFEPPVRGAEGGAPAGSSAGRWRRLPVSLAPGDRVRAAAVGAEGTLWLGTSRRLVKYRDGRQTDYANSQLLNDAPIIALREDREGNLWIGTAEGNTGAGLICKFPGEMIVSFTEADGLPSSYVSKVVESREGRIYVSTRAEGFAEIVDGKVVPIPGSQARPFNNAGNRFLQDARGDWWVGTDVGLYRFAGPRLQFRRGRKLGAADGIPEVGVFLGPGMYEDSRGRLWVSTGDELYVRDPQRAGKTFFEPLRLKDIPAGGVATVLAMREDASGAMWLASYGGLLRLADGRAETLQTSDGLPDTQARSFYQDARGRLWIGLRYKGVSVTDEPAARSPKFRNYSTANGLSGDAVGCTTEDDFGLIYLNGNGLNQIDPATGRVRRFTTADGLAGDEVIYCGRDRQGNIWVGSVGGVSRLDPRVGRDSEKHPPPVYLSRILVAGEEVALTERGAHRPPALSLSASQDSLSIEFVGLSFRAGRQIRYQYKLEGLDADWSAPVEQRALNFARLAPGSYRLLIRAVDQYDVTSREPAALEFSIAPPVWRRWWFVASALLLACVAAYALHRRRVGRLVELERVRTRIAADLHDDIGSNLSRIAILSEVARRRIEAGDGLAREPLATIAATSRELVDSMSDIVWATNPAKDQLGDLVQRMRRFASDVLTARDIEFSFRAPGAEASVGVGAEVRRQVFLIFKEAVNNVVRHADCTEVDIELRIGGGRLALTLRENGKGFDAVRAGDGHGLASMRARAASVGGSLDIIPGNGEGTTVILRAPLTAETKRGAGRVR